MQEGWEVEIVEFGKNRDALSDIGLTPRQEQQLSRNLRRLGEHGISLDANYFAKVKGSRDGLWEFRVSVQDCDVRVLYKLVNRTFVMLSGYKKKKKSDLSAARIRAVEQRLADWMDTHET